MTQPNIGAGNVVITLGNEEVELHPTLRAAMTLSNNRGGLAALIDRCLSLEFSAIETVIIAGMDGKGFKGLPQLIFDTGLMALCEPCIKFLNMLSNGGRPLGEEVEEEDANPLVKGSL